MNSGHPGPSSELSDHFNTRRQGLAQKVPGCHGSRGELGLQGLLPGSSSRRAAAGIPFRTLS